MHDESKRGDLVSMHGAQQKGAQQKETHVHGKPRRGAPRPLSAAGGGRRSGDTGRVRGGGGCRERHACSGGGTGRILSGRGKVLLTDSQHVTDG